MKFSLITTPIVLLLALVGLSSTAQAALKTGDSFKAWSVECAKLKTQEGKEVESCIVYQDFKDKSGKAVARTSFAYNKEKKQLIAEFLVPLGVMIQPGLGLKVDEAEPAGVPYAFCSPQGCKAVAPVPAELISTMKKGKKLRMVFALINGQKLIAEFSLSGFTAATRALKK